MQLEPIEIDDLFNHYDQVETIVGSLRCEPPITWGEWRREANDFWAAETDEDEPNWTVAGYLRIHMHENEVETDRGLLRERSFDVVKAWRPVCTGENMLDALGDFVGRFAVTDEGKYRRFPGTLYVTATPDGLGEVPAAFWKIFAAEGDDGRWDVQRRTAHVRWPSENV